MSGSPSRPARVLPGALLGLVLTAPSGLLAVPAASAAPRVEVEPLSEACGVRLSFAGLPARTFAVHLDLVALDPVLTLALTPPGAREVDGGRPSVLDVTAEGLAGATASRAYRATVALDGEAQPPVQLLLPECADPATPTASPAATSTAPPGAPDATPSPSGTAGPSGSGTATPSPATTASPAGSGTASPAPSGTAGPAPGPTSATSTSTIEPTPAEAPVFGPRAASAPASGASGSGVVALSGVAAAPLGALPELAAPAPVVAPPTGGVAAAVAAAPPLAAALPALPGRLGPVAAQPVPQTIAPEPAAAPPTDSQDAAAGPAAADGPWTTGLPAALLVTGAAAGALGLRLRRRRPQNP